MDSSALYRKGFVYAGKFAKYTPPECKSLRSLDSIHVYDLPAKGYAYADSWLTAEQLIRLLADRFQTIRANKESEVSYLVAWSTHRPKVRPFKTLARLGSVEYCYVYGNWHLLSD